MRMPIALVALTFVAALFSTTVLAETPSRIQQAEVFVGAPPEAMDAVHLNNIQTTPPAQNSTTLAAASGAAPALSYLQVSYVYSTNVGGWESISQYQTSINYDHGGAQLRVITDEIGYGNVPVARINGGVLTTSANYQTQYICVNSSGQYTTSCTTGQTVVGFRKYWRLDGYQNGVFSYQNTSTNSPWNTMSDSISIR